MRALLWDNIPMTIKHKLQQWLIKFLGIDTLVEENCKLREAINKIERCFHVGVDIQPVQGRHWAIICVQQTNSKSIIRFVDLSRRDFRQIDDFMRFFTPNKANKHWDMPHNFIL